MSRGGKRTGSGAKPLHGEPMRRVNVMLDTATINKALIIGVGSLSAGLREAVMRWHHLEIKPMAKMDHIYGERVLKVKSVYIRRASSWVSSEGASIDIVELADGRILGITNNVVIDFQDKNKFEDEEAEID